MTTELKQCQICGSGTLTDKSKQEKIEHRNESISFELVYSICDACGIEQTDGEQLRKNKYSCDGAKERFDSSVAENEV